MSDTDSVDETLKNNHSVHVLKVNDFPLKIKIYAWEQTDLIRIGLEQTALPTVSNAKLKRTFLVIKNAISLLHVGGSGTIQHSLRFPGRLGAQHGLAHAIEKAIRV